MKALKPAKTTRKSRARIERIENSVVKFTPDEQGTEDCPAVDISGIAYHSSDREMTGFGKPRELINTWGGFSEEPPPATYVTPNKNVAEDVASVFNANYIHEIDVDMDDAVDCRDLARSNKKTDRNTNRWGSWSDSEGTVVYNMREAKRNDKDGVIIPSTLGETGNEYIMFNPQEDAKIIGTTGTRNTRKRKTTNPAPQIANKKPSKKPSKKKPTAPRGAPKMPGKRA